MCHKVTPVIFHAALVDQQWPRCSQPSFCPQCHHNAILPCAGSVSTRRLCPAAAKGSVPSFRSPPLMLSVNGHRGRQEFGQAHSKRGGGGNLTKTPASAITVPKADGEWEPQPGWSRNGAGWLAMGQLQITAIPRQLSQEELVFVLVVWLYIPEVWLSFSLGIMTRWSS